MVRFWLPTASFLLALAVVFGALGAHALKLDTSLQAIFETANHYHTWNSLGLLVFSRSRDADLWLEWGRWLLLTGMLLFSGSLYLLAMTGFGPLGILTPFGGTALIIGWLLVAVHGWKRAKTSPVK